MSFARNPDDIIHPYKSKFNRLNNYLPKLYFVVGFFLVLALLLGMFYTIEPSEVGVVLRFGRFVGTTKPGLHVKIPFGIEQAIPVKVEYIYKEEFGFRTQNPGVRTTYDSRSYADESLMLTGDLNVLDLEWIVQFKIKDPYLIHFHIRDVRKTLRDISESVMRKIVGDYSFNEVLTTKRIEINDIVQQEMQQILDSYQAGLQIITVKLQDVNPPDPVKPAFNEVNEAKQEKEKLVNQAWEVYNRKIPQAKGEALKMIEEAQGYALEKVNTAAGDAARFILLQQEYALAKVVTRKRLYLEQMSAVLSACGKKYIVDQKQTGLLPLLNLKNE